VGILRRRSETDEYSGNGHRDQEGSQQWSPAPWIALYEAHRLQQHRLTFQKKDLIPLSTDDITFGITCGWF